MLTTGQLRVSTEDQIEHSPEAQRQRCGQYAKVHDLGPIQFLSDEGFSGKNLDRPAMQQLIGLIESGEVASLIVWRLDRLSRDVADQSRLIRMCEKFCVVLHSVNEGIVRVDTASGRMQAGIHGVFAQYYREQVVENVRMGQDQAASKGRWQNHPPSGYDLVNGELRPNTDAIIVKRIFRLRAGGKSYSEIERATGVKYSTVPQICLNPAYPTGRRIGKDLLAGKVRCGLCRKVICAERNAKGAVIYRCKHRGKGCDLSGRSAPGLHRATKLGLRLIGQDHELQDAIDTSSGDTVAGAARRSRAAPALSPS